MHVRDLSDWLRRLEVTMFDGFIDEMVDLGEVQLRVRFGGDGPPLLLIPGPRGPGIVLLRVW
jgi:haloacetate dehalogenase